MKKLRFIITLTSLLVLVLTAKAQGPGFEDDVDDDAPLDSGIALLVAGCISYGAKKIYNAKKNSTDINKG